MFTDSQPDMIRLSSPIYLSGSDRTTILGPGSDWLTISGDSDGDGTGNTGVFQVSSSSVAAIEGVTISDAYYSYGAIFNRGELAIDRVVIANNRAASYGGAIYNYPNSVLIINDSIIRDNQASYGGAICNDTVPC